MTTANHVTFGHNKYCGPAVLSILTGKSTDECANVISSVSGNYKVEGVELRHLLEAAKRLGFDSERIEHLFNLYATLVKLSANDGVYIIMVKGHFIVIEILDRKIYLCDNHTKEQIPASSSARLQDKVLAVYKVYKRREPIHIKTTTIVNCKYVEDDNFEIQIHKHVQYDISEHDKMLLVGKFNLSRQESEQLATKITEAINVTN